MLKTQIIAEPGVPQLVISTELAAARDLVFRAYTDPHLLVRWLGPRRMTMAIDRFDLRHGGTWRFVHYDVDGRDYGFRGVFHGAPSPSGVVWTFESEDMPGHVCLETITFEERADKTVVIQNTAYQSVEDRDAALASGMEEGINESMERLDELLARQQLAVPTHSPASSTSRERAARSAGGGRQGYPMPEVAW